MFGWLQNITTGVGRHHSHQQENQASPGALCLPTRDLLWSLGSLCALHRIPFSSDLIQREFPPEESTAVPAADVPGAAEPTHNESTLIRAALALGFRIKAIRFSASKAQSLPLPLLVQLKGESFSDPASPIPASTTSLALITAADPDNIVYFQSGSQQPITCSTAEFDTLHTGSAWLATPAPETVADDDGQSNRSSGSSSSSSPSSVTQVFGFRWFRPELL
jgi:ATP-binding cassette, subfamily B, bacterial HlyB/CyaB